MLLPIPLHAAGQYCVHRPTVRLQGEDVPGEQLGRQGAHSTLTLTPAHMRMSTLPIMRSFTEGREAMTVQGREGGVRKRRGPEAPSAVWRSRLRCCWPAPSPLRTPASAPARPSPASCIAHTQRVGTRVKGSKRRRRKGGGPHGRAAGCAMAMGGGNSATAYDCSFCSATEMDTTFLSCFMDTTRLREEAWMRKRHRACRRAL